jgi:hypothetical protein
MGELKNFIITSCLLKTGVNNLEQGSLQHNPNAPTQRKVFININTLTQAFKKSQF